MTLDDIHVINNKTAAGELPLYYVGELLQKFLP